MNNMPTTMKTKLDQTQLSQKVERKQNKKEKKVCLPDILTCEDKMFGGCSPENDWWPNIQM